MHDLRYAIRGLTRTPAYTLAVVAVLAVGMTMTTVTIAIVDGVLFKPLPFRQAEELFVIHAQATTQPQAEAPPVSFRHIDAWRNALPELTFSGVSAAPDRTVMGPGHEYWTASIDDRFFDLTGQAPLLGGFSAADFDGASNPEETRERWWPQVISYRVWRTLYGEDPAVIGRTVVTRESGGRTFGYRIVGVLPPDFVFPVDGGGAQPDILTPITRGLQRTNERRFHAIVRVPKTVNLIELRERLTTAVRSVPSLGSHGAPTAAAPFDHVRLTSVQDHVGGDERGDLWIATSGAALMLLVCCVNVAGLAAARNLVRRRELAVRRALGATARHLLRGVAYEVAILALCATSIALASAGPLLTWLATLLPPTMTLLKAPDVDTRVFVMAALVTSVTVLAVTLWPARVAWQVRADGVANPLSGSATLMGRRARAAIIAAQVALAFVLVSAGGFSVASFAAAWRTDPGFARARMILFEAFVTQQQTSGDAVDQLRAAHERLLKVPGITDVALASVQPLFGRQGTAFSRYTPAGSSEPPPGVAAREVTSNYFDVMGLDLLRGRWPMPGEWADTQPVAMVSAAAARRLWPDRSAIGQRLVARFSKREPEYIVIGVVQDARYSALDAEPLADIYLPEPIGPTTYGAYFHVRTDRSAADVLPAAVAAFGPGFRLEQAATHEDALFAAIKHRALPAWGFGVIAIAAVFVVGVGILGLLSVSVAQRTREMGVRLALGARAGALIRLVMAEQLAAVLVGVPCGFVFSAWTVQVARSHLYGVGPYDPVTWTAILGGILCVSVVATLIPAVRATRVNPVESLRAE
jgi:putative ABC transport system permease protein